MKHNIPITIDTSELAREMDAVSSKVDQATTAVNTMNAAVVLAEQKAADKICADVNQGRSLRIGTISTYNLPILVPRQTRVGKYYSALKPRLRVKNSSRNSHNKKE